MADFQFLLNPYSSTWVVSAPRRSRRPDQAKGTATTCPFCPGNETDEEELYRIGGEPGDAEWEVRVLPNKFPFAPVHEVIIDTPQDAGGFDTWSDEHTVKILQTYRQRFQTHKEKGLVYIFHNSGPRAGESLPHPHTQLAVIPRNVTPQIPKLEYLDGEETLETNFFQIFCPKTSQWPDEVWIAAKTKNMTFGDASDEELEDLARTLKRLINIFDMRHGNDFPYNFYIYPGTHWYLRIMPRKKTLGGFELGTGIFVNTQDPKETFTFIKEHFRSPNVLSIKLSNQADYAHHV